MNKALIISIIATLVLGCDPARKLPEGSPEVIKPRDLREKIAGAENDFKTLRVRGMGHYSDESQSQNFKLEVRIARDSLIWVDIADPILGIKVARAVITDSNFSFMNRIDKEYLQGDIKDFQKEFNVPYGFKELQRIFSANLLFDINEDFELYYQPGRYLLSDFDPENNDDPSEVIGRELFRQIFLDPLNYKAVQHIQKEPAYGRNVEVEYQDIVATTEDFLYPKMILISYLEGNETELKIDVKKVEKDEPGLNYPFKIPEDYARMD